ncbi:MAG TPA: aminoglycoside phosphotransferase family protein [Planctomycetota bacterium]|nr:aminoglycoside phosphotransferase family protein [Planctomycetota bacterium]
MSTPSHLVRSTARSAPAIADQGGWVAELSTLVLDPATARDLGAGGAELRLRRAWPRSPDHVVLELQDGRGRAVAGQWMRDGGALEPVAAETASRCDGVPLAIVTCRSGAVLLQPGGADRALVALHRLVAHPAANLLAHRPERRGVVRLAAGEGKRERYVKVVPPERVDRLTGPLLRLADRDLGFRVPRIVEVVPEDGRVTFEPLPGSSLHQLVRDGGALRSAAHAAGRALRSLHDQTGIEARRHDAARVVEELKRRVRQLDALDPAASDPLARALPAVIHGLEAGATPLVPVHRDFHDKQVVLDRDGVVGVLDFDTLSLGEPALDVANALAHFELRALQGLTTEDAARDAARALYDGYAPPRETAARLEPYLDATRLRLACLYALRPLWPGIPDRLLARVGLAGLADEPMASTSARPERTAPPPDEVTR